jgi:hypothetical protein
MMRATNNTDRTGRTGRREDGMLHDAASGRDDCTAASLYAGLDDTTCWYHPRDFAEDWTYAGDEAQRALGYAAQEGKEAWVSTT